jgi:hypothetical protein
VLLVVIELIFGGYLLMDGFLVLKANEELIFNVERKVKSVNFGMFLVKCEAWLELVENSSFVLDFCIYKCIANC